MKPEQTQEKAFQTPPEVLKDADCTITVNGMGPIEYYHTPAPQNVQDANRAISQLTIDDIWQVPPYTKPVGSVTLEVLEVLEGGGRVLVILINGIYSPNMISYINVQGNLASASTVERRTYVQRMAQLGLARSLGTGQSVDVNGPCR